MFLKNNMFALNMKYAFCLNVLVFGCFGKRLCSWEIDGQKGEKGETGHLNFHGSVNETGIADSLEFLRSQMEAFGLGPLCTLGIKDGRIGDGAMRASTSYSVDYQPFFARPDRSGEVQAHWMPSSNVGSWLEVRVDIKASMRVVGVITQGRPSYTYDHHVRTYKIAYSNSTENFTTIRDPREPSEDLIFQGNSDRSSKVTNHFPEPIIAQYFRFLPITWHHTPSLRIEYLIC